MPVDREDLLGNSRDVHLRFFHPAVPYGFPDPSQKGVLIVRTGANRIKWSYQLNTRRIPTYGGEVVQILSAKIGRLSVSGNTSSNVQLAGIYRWFRMYMSQAGLTDENHGHTQTPITFSYPERGWQMGIYVVAANGFTLGLTNVATEWSIEAEINQDDESLLASEIMNPMRYSMTSELGGPQPKVPMGIGYDATHRWSAPIVGAARDSRITDAAMRSLQDRYANKIGTSFDSLIAAWSSGEFENFIFDATMGPNYNDLSPADEYYERLFGSPYIDGKGGTGQGSTPVGGGYGGGGLTWPGATATRQDVAKWMARNAASKGLPPELPVMASLVETGGTLANLDHGHADSLGLFQMRTSVWLASYPGYPTNPDIQMKWFTDQAVKLIPPAKADGFQAPWDAVKLGDFAQAVENSAFPERYKERYAEAVALIQGWDAAGGPGTNEPLPSDDEAVQGVKTAINSGRITFRYSTTARTDLLAGGGHAIGGPEVTIHANLYKVIVGILNTPGIMNIDISSVISNHNYLSASGNVSQHSMGQGMDIDFINGQAVRDGSNFWDSMVAFAKRPEAKLVRQIISPRAGLSAIFGSNPYDNDGDHEDHIHIGINP